MAKLWLTEREIGDILAKDPYGHFGSGPWHVDHCYFREPQLGTIRPDFMGLSTVDGGLNIQLIELKITADANSVSQLIKYRNFWLDQFDHFDKFQMPKRARQKGFEIELQLFARFFEASVYPLAKALNICLQRVTIVSKTEIKVDFEDDGDRYQFDPMLNKLLLDTIKDEQHGEAVH